MKCCEECGQPVPDYGGIIADDDRGEVRFGGAAVHLTVQEYEVFKFLLGKRGRTASKESILDHLYQLSRGGEVPDIKIVDVFICKARKKLDRIGVKIETAWGRGYWLADPTVPHAAATVAPPPVPNGAGLQRAL